MNNNFLRIDHYGCVVSEIGSARLDREESNEEAETEGNAITQVNVREW